MDTAPETLTIGELAARTGLTTALIRRWETRHGYPVPVREDGGPRRYDVGTAQVLQSVLRKRQSGLQLSVALADALGATAPFNPSLFGTLRAAHPELPVHRLTFSVLVAFSHAIEDECFAGGDAPIVFGLFQHESNFLDVLARWTDLADVSRATYVFADFPPDQETMSPVRVPLPHTGHLRQEWAIVCDAVPGRGDAGPPTLPVVMSARQAPGQDATPKRERVFDVLWSLDPAVVRTAARLCARVAVACEAPGAGDLAELLAEGAGGGSPATPAATALFGRVLTYTDALAV